MLFTSPSFFLLLVLCFLAYYLVKKQIHQVIILICSSFIFYAWEYPLLLLLLCISIAINIFASYGISNSEGLNRKKIAFLGVIANLTILCFFKYSPLIGNTFFDETNSLGKFLISIPLPIGISFFTFQGISLVVDTFKENKNENTLKLPKEFVPLAIHITLFKSFFPQLIAGPIVKAHEYLPQISFKKFNQINWEYCAKKLIVGYFLKMVVADNLKDHTFNMAYPYFIENSGFNLLYMLLGYSMQIFADFAGYSSIALGLSGLFGYQLIENFMFPYISSSFSEFWRRWHISLSTFLKEYLYIPLGGNKKGNIRTYINLMITMILGGLWHGAAWSYAVWGTFHGVALALERLFNDTFTIKFPKVIKIIFTFLAVTFAWLLFKLPEFGQVALYIEKIFTNSFLPKSNELNPIFYISIYSFPVVIYHLMYLYKNAINNRKLALSESILYAIMLFFIFVNSGSSGDFIYFQF
jgi:alginate O-acetyltransferase complex protein AlgI